MTTLTPHTGRQRRLAALAAAAICCLIASPPFAAAQATQPKPRTPASAPKPGGTAPPRPAAPASAPPRSPADTAARDQVLKSPKFLETMSQFNDWLTTQSLYDQQQVRQMRARLEAGIPRLSAGQLQRLMVDLQAKLAVFNSSEAQGIEEYLAETFAVASPAYARKLRQKLPDVLSMNAAQISQQLAMLSAKRQATIQAQQAFQDGQQREISYNEAQLAAAEKASERALDRADASAASAGSRAGNYTSARDYFPNVGNDGPFGPGTSVGFGLGFF